MKRVYLCIDLKSFYASVECALRGLDSLSTNLVVADDTRGEGTICLAVSPAMKKLGVKNRCRVFEIPHNIEYIKAKPRMKLYIKISADIYSIYLRYFSKDDIHVYSIDECFIDVTNYLKLYKTDAKSLAKKIIDTVYEETKIHATAGIGTNLFLAKVALDVMAKKSKDYIGYLDQELFKEKIWYHQPITDIWNIGKGIAKRLKLKFGIMDLHGIATYEEPKKLYKEFGINAELLIDHANGIETCLIEDIKKYKPKNNSLSYGQVLFEDYEYQDAFLVMKEMIDLAIEDLVDKNLITKNIFLSIGYSKNVIEPTGGSVSLDEYTCSKSKILLHFKTLFKKTTNQNYLIRRINIGFNDVIYEEDRPITLFTSSSSIEEQKEKRLEQTIVSIKKKFGKNSIMKVMNLDKKATTPKRNKLIGGHNGE